MGAVSNQKLDEGDQHHSSKEGEGRHKDLGPGRAACLHQINSAGLGCVSRHRAHSTQALCSGNSGHSQEQSRVTSARDCPQALSADRFSLP